MEGREKGHAPTRGKDWEHVHVDMEEGIQGTCTCRGQTSRRSLYFKLVSSEYA